MGEVAKSAEKDIITLSEKLKSHSLLLSLQPELHHPIVIHHRSGGIRKNKLSITLVKLKILFTFALPIERTGIESKKNRLI